MGLKGSKKSYTFATFPQEKLVTSDDVDFTAALEITSGPRKQTLQNIKSEIVTIENEIKITTINDDNYKIYGEALCRCSSELDKLSKKVVNRFKILLLRKRILRLTQIIISRKIKTDINLMAYNLEQLKKDIKIAKLNKDLEHLNKLSHSMNLLIGNFDSLDTCKEYNNQKIHLENNLLQACRDIMATKQQLQLEKKENNIVKREKCLVELEKLNTSISSTFKDINESNFGQLKLKCSVFIQKLNSIEDFDEAIMIKKANAMNLILNANNSIVSLEVIEDLKQAANKLDMLKSEIVAFPDVEFLNEFLLDLIIDVEAIFVVNENVERMKEIVEGNIGMLLNMLEEVPANEQT